MCTADAISSAVQTCEWTRIRSFLEAGEICLVLTDVCRQTNDVHRRVLVDCMYTRGRIQTAMSRSPFARQSPLTVIICDARVFKYSQASQVLRVKDTRVDYYTSDQSKFAVQATP